MERRRKTITPASAQACGGSQIDTDDLFHQKMAEFVKRTSESTQSVSNDCKNAFVAYKELGIFFDDLRSVWPPPASEQDRTTDLFSIFHKFFEDVKHHAAEVEQASLRDDVASRQQVGSAPRSGPSGHDEGKNSEGPSFTPPDSKRPPSSPKEE